MLRAVRRAGFRLRGRVRGLFVCDEESGQPGSGLSAGMRAAVQHLFEGERTTPDFAIYAEPTDAAVYTAQMGFLIAGHHPDRPVRLLRHPELGVDALRAGHALLAALWEHDEALRSAMPTTSSATASCWSPTSAPARASPCPSGSSCR